MRIIRGIKIGGLQQKLFNLMLIFVLALVLVFVAVSVYQQRNLKSVVEDASTRQQASITEVSEQRWRRSSRRPWRGRQRCRLISQEICSAM